MGRTVSLALTSLAALLLMGSAILIATLAVPKEARAAFPGQNGRIAYYANVDGGPSDIFSVFPNGSGLKQHTSSGIAEIEPAWSPDGSKIVFVRYAQRIQSDIFVKNTRNGEVSRLTKTSDSDQYPAWSPDGSEIVFSSDRSGNPDIWVMEADGTDARRLTNDPADELEPAWSPDGTKIAFERDSQDIWVMNADGSDAKSVYHAEHVCCQDGTPETPVFPGQPAWSPDGSQIVFSGLYYVSDYFDGGYSPDIYEMNADGSGRVNLTNTPHATEAHPAWSPNGKKVAFTSFSPDQINNDIVRIGTDGSNRVNITNTPTVGEWSPDWGPKPSSSR